MDTTRVRVGGRFLWSLVMLAGLLRCASPEPLPVEEPRALTDFNGTLFFIAPQDVYFPDGDYTLRVHTLWRSNGTAASTVGLGNPIFDVDPSVRNELAPFQGRLFFRGADTYNGFELWTSDGTEEGTRLFKAIELGESGSFPHGFEQVGGTLFFTANQFFEGAPTGSGIELWKTDGTFEGTVRVKDIEPGLDSSSPRELTAVGGLLYFVADTGAAGLEVWKSDGTAEGTVLVKDIVPGPEGSEPRELVGMGGRLFFVATDDVHGFQLWRSDGTEAGTQRVHPTAPAEAAPSDLTPVGDRLFFVADAPGLGRELWVTDGTAGGTHRVRDIAPGGASSAPRGLVASGGRLFFSAEEGHGRELWVSDGTVRGTRRVRDIAPGPASGLTEQEVPRPGPGGTVLFAANDGRTGLEPWVSDGTVHGTRRLGDIAPGAPGSNPREFTVSGGRVYFAADDGLTGPRLWTVPLGRGAP